METRGAAVVDVEQLSRRFGTRLAVDGLTFTLAPGEIVALLGPNGAGKTTTLRLLAGLIAPSSGRGTVAGAPLGPPPDPALHARVGLLTETPGLWDRLTVRMNLVIHARLHALPDPAARVRAVIARLGLGGRENDPAGVLSKGLRQRVALARAVLHTPRLLLLDEPTSGLDPAAASQVRRLITELREDGTAILVCTHNLAEAEALADRIGVLRATLLALDTPAALRRRSDVPAPVTIVVEGAATAWSSAAASPLATLCTEVTAAGSTLGLTLAAGTAVPDVVAALVTAGARVVAVEPSAPSLETAYLALVHRDD
ncbi:MAG TPA: ABC transporter ATP-binding protein [Vicinamibacterales bacterium]|nr:ABC transporter ATP-binding protein [Vicinamibacterales bacterium]